PLRREWRRDPDDHRSRPIDEGPRACRSGRRELIGFFLTTSFCFNGVMMKFAARSALIAFALASGCGDASVDGSNGNGYPNPPPPPFDAGTGGAGGTGTGGTGGSGAQPPVPPKDGGNDADARDAF